MATKVASKTRKAASKSSVQKRRNQVLKSVKNMNCMVVDFTEDMIEETVATGTKYQKLAVKAIKKSEPIIEKQVDMFFDTAELALGQIQDNSKRFQKLLGITKQVNKATETIGKIVKTVSEKVEDRMDIVEKNVKTLRGEIKKSPVRKAIAKNVSAKKATAKKTVAKATKTVKGSAAKSVAKATKAIKAPAKKRATKAAKTVKTQAKNTAKKVTAKKATAKKATAKKVTAKKVTAKKTTAKRATAKKATAKKAVRKTATKK